MEDYLCDCKVGKYFLTWSKKEQTERKKINMSLKLEKA